MSINYVFNVYLTPSEMSAIAVVKTDNEDSVKCLVIFDYHIVLTYATFSLTLCDEYLIIFFMLKVV